MLRTAKSHPPIAADAGGPAGVAGWLFLLVAQLMILGPVFAASRLHLDLMMIGLQHPNLMILGTWRTFEWITWFSYVCMATLSFLAGWRLARGRKLRVIAQAKLALWIIGPVGFVLNDLLIPLAILGTANLGVQFLVGLFASMLGAAIWTAYLSVSTRVKATYTLA